MSLAVVLPLEKLLAASLEPAIHDLYVQPTHHGVTGAPRRIAAPDGALNTELDRLGFYSTGNGYLSQNLRSGR